MRPNAIALGQPGGMFSGLVDGLRHLLDARGRSVDRAADRSYQQHMARQTAKPLGLQPGQLAPSDLVRRLSEEAVEQPRMFMDPVSGKVVPALNPDGSPMTETKLRPRQGDALTRALLASGILPEGSPRAFHYDPDTAAQMLAAMTGPTAPQGPVQTPAAQGPVQASQGGDPGGGRLSALVRFVADKVDQMKGMVPGDAPGSAPAEMYRQSMLTDGMHPENGRAIGPDNPYLHPDRGEPPAGALDGWQPPPFTPSQTLQDKIAALRTSLAPERTPGAGPGAEVPQAAWRQLDGLLHLPQSEHPARHFDPQLVTVMRPDWPVQEQQAFAAAMHKALMTQANDPQTKRAEIARFVEALKEGSPQADGPMAQAGRQILGLTGPISPQGMTMEQMLRIGGGM